MVKPSCSSPHEGTRVTALLYQSIKLASHRQPRLPEHIGGDIDMILLNHISEVIVVNAGNMRDVELWAFAGTLGSS